MNRTLHTLKRAVRTTLRAFAMAYKIAPIRTLTIGTLTILVALVPLLQASIMGRLINKLVDTVKTHSPLETAVGLVVLYASIWALSLFLSAIRLYVDKAWSLELEHGLDLITLRKRTEIDLGHYEKADFQDLLHRAFNRGIWPMFELAETQFANISNIVMIVLTSSFALTFSPVVYITVLVTSIPRFIIELRYGNKVWSLWAEHGPRQRKYQHLRTHFLSRVGVVQTKMLQAEKSLLGMVEGVLSSFKNDQLLVDRRRLFYTIGAGAIAAMGYGFGLYVIVKDVWSGLIALGTMTFLVSALGQMVGSISSLLNDVARQNEKRHYAEDMFEVLDTKPFIKRSQHPHKLNIGTPPTIEFRDVWFRYENKTAKTKVENGVGLVFNEDPYTLKGVNLIINPGESIALVGDNGAGKTTMVKLLSRIYDPSKGDIFVNGVNLKEIDVDEWNSYLSVFLQDWVGYDFLVGESIAMGRSIEAVSEEKARRSAQIAEAHSFIDVWPGKYSTQLGTEFGGEEPSKGQQQKIALARALYREGLVLVLDEPTASVDGSSEARIFEKLGEVAGKRTLILISHRFNTVRGVDKIIVLSNGVVAEEGDHETLIAQDGLYAKLFNEQAKGYRDVAEEAETSHELGEVEKVAG
ncbi:MAG: ABC transporter ATP-binding protein [Candidatus Pacebacteria bacterium]|nr:ABC transporter ATP-binding protein [Candidatus Paceibacterota bacterium]